MSIVPTSSSAPPVIVIQAFRGETTTRQISAKVNNVVTDIDELYTDFWLDIRVNRNTSSRLLLSLTVGNGLEVSNGLLILTITPAQSNDIEAGSYWCDLFAEDLEGKIKALFTGRFELLSNTTDERANNS